MDFSNPEVSATLFQFVLIMWSCSVAVMVYYGAMQTWPGHGAPEEHLYVVLSIMVVFTLIALVGGGLDKLYPALMPYYRLPEIIGMGIARAVDALGIQPLTAATYRYNVGYALTLQYAAQAYIAILTTVWGRHLLHRYVVPPGKNKNPRR